MRTHTAKNIATLFLAILLFSANVYSNSESSIMEWYGNNNFSFNETGNSLNVSINKNPWESFTLKIDNKEILNNPIVNIDIMTSEDITLRVDISDGTFMSSNNVLVQQHIIGNSMFSKMSFDFSEVLSNVELDENAFLIFIVNPGEKFTGEISISSVKFTVAEDQLENNNNNNSELNIFPSPATSFTNVVIPDGTFEQIRILDMTGKIVAEFDVTYYSNTTYRVELDQLNAGYYVVQLTSEKSVLTNKLIVN
nr:T9SS type A sorting domain-containing protein [Bacteroidota bacterium]